MKRKMDQNSLNDLLCTVKCMHLQSKCQCNPNIDPNENCEMIDSHLTEAMDRCTPMTHVRFNKYKHKKQGWITSGILQSLKYRDTLYRKLKRKANTNGYDTLAVNLKTYNTILRKSLREAKRIYFTEKFNKTKGDMKKSWSVLKSLLNSRHKYSGATEFFHNNSLIKDPALIAENFNTFFLNVGSDIRDIPNAKFERCKYLKKAEGISFRFKPVSEETVNKTIQNLTSKNSTGIDGLSTKLLKFIREPLIPILCITINQSLNTGIFPSKLKHALVKPLHKKDSEQYFQNYRPISLLPAISKVFEKIVHKQVYDYCILHKLLYGSQYGFRENHSTEHAVIELTDRILSDLDSGKLPIAIFLDFSKAFDMIDHSILLEKLYKYGFEGESLNWFQSYLYDRSQCVEFGGHRSSFLSLDKGVPQGSVLGPLLFLIYINDIHTSCEKFKFILYADDTTLTAPVCTFTHGNSVTDDINSNLKELSHWLNINKLQLNIAKSKFMVFHFRQRKLLYNEVPTIKISDIPMQRVSEFNFLGVLMDECLTWNAHVNKISNKISKIIGIMNKQKRVLPTKILKLMYDSFILPHINYCISCWGFNIKRISKLQKRAIRVVFKTKYNAHTDPLFKQGNLLKAHDLFKLSHLKLYHKFVNSNLPSYLSHMFTPNVHRYNTRSQLPAGSRNRTTGGMKRIRCHLPKILDTTLTSITEKIHTHSLHGFSQYYRNHIVSTYLNECTIRDCYICRG